MSKWVARKISEAQERRKHEVVFYTYPKFLFCWPLIFMGFLLWLLDRQQWASPETLAWIWGITVIVVVITMGIDLNRNYTIFWLVVIGGFWILVLWLRDVKSVRIFSHIYDFLVNLDPVYSRNLGLMVSMVLLVLFLIMWVGTRVNSKWRITHNEFEHYQLGRMDDSLARGAKRVRTSYPDFFELLLCLAGDLIIFDSTGRKELRRIPHVPMLPLVRKRIDRILETTSITVGEIEDEVEAVETNDEADRGI